MIAMKRAIIDNNGNILQGLKISDVTSQQMTTSHIYRNSQQSAHKIKRNCAKIFE